MRKRRRKKKTGAIWTTKERNLSIIEVERCWAGPAAADDARDPNCHDGGGLDSFTYIA